MAAPPILGPRNNGEQVAVVARRRRTRQHHAALRVAQRRRYLTLGVEGPAQTQVIERVVLQKDFVTTASSGVEVGFDVDATTDQVRGYVDRAQAEPNERFSPWWCDYLAAGSSQNGWGSSTSGTGSGFGQNYDIVSSYPVFGVQELRTGTTTSGRAALTTWNNVFDPDSGGFAVDFEASVMVPDLSGGGEDYIVHLGFGDDWGTNGEHAECAGFVYRQATDGDFWVAQTRDGGVETKTVTAVAPSTAGFQTLRVTGSSDGLTWTFYIDGTQVAQHTTNVPDGRLGLGVRIYKTGGTTNRELYIDWHRLIASRSSDR